jgi:hypothetical protein
MPGKDGKIAACLRMPGARKNPTCLRDQGKHVTRLHDVVGRGVGGGRHADRVRAIGRGDAGRYALGGLDRHGEVGAVRGPVHGGHRRKVQLSRPCVGDRHADETAAEACHEIDRVGRHAIGGEHEVPFVFAILLVDEHDHPPRLHLGDDLDNRCDRHRSSLEQATDILPQHRSCARPCTNGQVREPKSAMVARVSALDGSV